LWELDPDELTPEQRAEWDRVEAERERSRELHERFAKKMAYRAAVRDGLLPPSWVSETYGSPVPSKPKRKGKRGKPIDYNIDGGITAAAEAVAERGVDDSQSDFIARVYAELADRRIKAPGVTWMKKHIGSLHKRLKRDTRRAKAAQKPPTNKTGR